ncbi:MAG: FG-GAP-like repeat-containing protein [Pirellulales bacterium]
MKNHEFADRGAAATRRLLASSLLASGMAVGGLALGGCNPSAPMATPVPDSPDAATAASDDKRGQATAARADAQTLPTLFTAPRFELTDQDGATFGSKQLDGRVWLANFMFTHCKATCPRQAARLLELQERIGHWPHAARVRFVSATVDPKRDTPERLHEYAQSIGARTDRWKFLTGDRTALWKLSKEGFRLPVADNALDTDNPFTHSSQLALVDARSRVRGVYDAMVDDDLPRLLRDLQIVLSEPVLNAPDPVAIGVPGDIFDPAWLDARHAAQLSEADRIGAFHGFRFEDRVEQSGITFIDRPVADAAKRFKSNHYDHANGIAAADVDGDGRVDLFFTAQRGGNQLWRNLGDGRFENITEQSGTALADRVCVAASFADTDNDGDPDLFVTTTRHGNAFFVNEGAGKFVDRTESSGLTYVGHSSAADFFDYDRDGRLDLLVTNVGRFTTDRIGYSGDEKKQESPYYVGTETSFAGHLFPELKERSILYRNEGENRFRDVSDEMQFDHRAWSGDATPFDANGDGWIDLYVLNMQGDDFYYENQEGRRFHNRSHAEFPNPVWGGMGVKAFDYDNNGQLELFVTNMHADMWDLQPGVLGPDDERARPRKSVIPSVSYLNSRDASRNVFGNAFYVARSDGRYEDVALHVNAENYWPWGPSVGDLNADGFQDLFIASCMNYPFRYHVNSVRLNDGGQLFRDAEFILGVEPRQPGRRAYPWFELDFDGADARHKLSPGRNGKAVVYGAAGTRSAAIFDLDDDGDLDIVTAEFNSPPQVLVSNLAQQKPDLRRLSVRLQGSRSNRDGLGAVVQVRVGLRTLTQVHDGQSGYLSQSAMPLYFGLADAEAADEVIVRWPSGVVQKTAGPIAANQLLTIVEPTEAP